MAENDNLIKKPFETKLLEEEKSELEKNNMFRFDDTESKINYLFDKYCNYIDKKFTKQFWIDSFKEIFSNFKEEILKELREEKKEASL